MRIFSVLLLLAAAATVSARQDSPSKTTAPDSVGAAEKEGTTHPRGAPPASLGPSFEPGGNEGTAERKCVEFPVGIQPANRRSGEIIVGGSIGALKAGEEGKVWWAPLHDPAGAKSTLVVRSARLDAANKTSLFTSKDYAWPIAPGGREHAFFPSGFGLPESGHWLLTATSGDDWGCFIVTVR